MKKKNIDLSFVNYLKTLARSLNNINDIISDSYQHQDLNENELALIEKIHESMYWSGEVKFDKGNIDSSKLRVVKRVA